MSRDSKSDLKRIKPIFSEALDKKGCEREVYLQSACGDDSDVIDQVKRLLEAHEQAGDFMESPVLEDELKLDISPIAEQPGTIIGSYKLLEKIGEGGMAVVYMAEQEQPIRRRVALKIIKLGMDTKSVIARFEAERQALAMMDHPNIAKVFDAGATETGRPYFVMELVTGISVTEYCDKNKLNMRERLALFIQVCNAVQHAHQKGIIHRDIKPSNIMVTLHDGKPVPKVIDFGIAKATNQRLTEKTLFTRYAHIIGTPAYMSPEQSELSDVNIDTRSDIYSLGVLLYELLTGTPPFSEQELRKSGYLEMQQIIRGKEPLIPSAKLTTLGETLVDVARQRCSTPELLGKAVRGDLDWIVMKSLEKDRSRRYSTAIAFAEDIDRHLNHELVLAGQPDLLYRSRKFVERHAKFVIVVAFMAATVIAGLITSTLMYMRAESARVEAQNTVDFLANDLFASVYPENAKSQEVTVRYFLDHASESIENKFSNSPLSEARVREVLGITYQKLGDFEEAAPHLERALEIRKEQLGADDPATLCSMNHVGNLYYNQGRYAEAEPLLTRAMETRIRVLGEEHPDTIESLCNVAWLHLMWSDWDKGVELISKTVQIGRRVLGEEHRVTLSAVCGLAMVHMTKSRVAEAEALVTKGYEVSSHVLGDEHETTLYLMNMLVWVHQARERYDIAEELGEKALEISQRVVGEKHQATMFAISNMGWTYTFQDRYEDANELLFKSVDLGRRYLGEAHGLTLWFSLRLSYLYYRMGLYEQHDELVDRSLEICRRVHGENYPLTNLFKYWAMEREKRLKTPGDN